MSSNKFNITEKQCSNCGTVAAFNDDICDRCGSLAFRRIPNENPTVSIRDLLDAKNQKQLSIDIAHGKRKVPKALKLNKEVAKKSVKIEEPKKEEESKEREKKQEKEKK